MTQVESRAQLGAFIAKYSPEIEAEGRAALAFLRRLLPGAIELVYDNYRWLVVGFCPTERPSDAIVFLVFTPSWITLCFLQGASQLPDPHGLLRGTGKNIRNVRLQAAKDLRKPEVRTLIAEALTRARVPIATHQRGHITIRSVSARQLPRRP